MGKFLGKGKHIVKVKVIGKGKHTIKVGTHPHTKLLGKLNGKK